MAITIVQKGDLDTTAFSNNNSNNAQGITVRVDAGSTVKSAIDAAIAAIPSAGDATRGLVRLSVAANYPQAGNDTEAVTPAYLAAAVAAAIAALPGDKFLQGLQSYDPATNTMTLVMNDSTTATVDLTGLLNDAVATITTGKVQVFGNDGSTLLGYLLPV